MRKNIYVDIHLLQDVPPANLNRDDTGSPKSARYGGVDRLRVSSQAWKRATRKHFEERMDPQMLGIRTRRVREILTDALVAGDVPADVAKEIVTELLLQIKLTAGKKESESAYLLFFSRPQIALLVDEVTARREQWADPKSLASEIDMPRILGRGHSLDVALFGRMVADLAEINVDAAAQVSHALATHAAPTQFDYFTAVDDAQQRDESGAGMIGTVEFNSATLYRFATVNVPALIENMDDEAAAIAGLEQFVRSFVSSMPSGKQNTFAAHTRPGLVLVAVRSDQPVNYMSAFEKPVQAGQTGYMLASVKALSSFVTGEGARWGDVPMFTALSCATGLADAAVELGTSSSFEEVVQGMCAAVGGALRHG